MKYAFRCKTCGRYETSDHAAVFQHPHACRVCSAGVVYSPQGHKTVLHENWEVLADCVPERLAELGLTPDMVERHVPWTKEESVARDPVHIRVEAHEAAGTVDRAG